MGEVCPETEQHDRKGMMIMKVFNLKSREWSEVKTIRKISIHGYNFIVHRALGYEDEPPRNACYSVTETTSGAAMVNCVASVDYAIRILRGRMVLKSTAEMDEAIEKARHYIAEQSEGGE
jgi:hypothetical protein